MNQAALHRMLAEGVLKNPKKASPEKLFELRLTTNLGLIKELFTKLYPKELHPKSFEKLIDLLPALFKTRSEELKHQDLLLLKKGAWYQSQKMVGMQLYVDLFNKDLKGVEAKIPYFKKLGINLLHLMPITTRPKGENDGGYAVNSYTAVDKRFGTQKDLLELTAKLRANNIFLMLDFVVNHTSEEYPWAKKALAGSVKYQGYYHMFPDRNIPDAFEATLPEVFPTTSPGNFTYRKEIDRWVMTVFNTYQWDLNYSNPQVFMEMLSNLIAMVNAGVDVVRFDALAFLWKKIGTISQNLPEAHLLIALFRMCLQTVAPGVILLAEAIVAPRDIVKYFGEGNLQGNECEVAYNASLMALLWNSIATKKTLLLYKSLKSIPQKPKETTWINYLRCHDDIGLGFENQHIYEIGWDADMHRRFLLDYYCQVLDWSPATGYVFMHNPKTGDGRITGSCASLAGLEKALSTKNQNAIQQAIDKIIMLHSIILSYGGIPLIYAGDELGTLNDYSYLNDTHKKEDSRWVNRPGHDWNAVKTLSQKEKYPSVIFHALKWLIGLRKKLGVLADSNNTMLHETNNPHVLIYERTGIKDAGVLVLCNFDEHPQVIDGSILNQLCYLKNGAMQDIVSSKTISLNSGLVQLDPYQFFWLMKA